MTYVSNIKTAMLVFPFLAAALTLPYLVYQYRKFGSIPWWKSLLVFSFSFYLLCAYFMVILPLPVDRTAFVPAAAHPQLEPFSFVRDIMAGSTLDPASPVSWLRWLRTPVVYVTLFNLLLTMPFGGYLRYFFHRKWWQAVVLGFLLSLFFEISQLSGLFGLYAHPYRLFDVDDLIVNTSGALLGFWVSIPLTRFLPDIDRMNERAIEKGEHRTSFTRRLLAFGIDMVAASVAASLLGAALPGMFRGDAGALACQMVATGAVFMLVPAVTGGRTLGHLALKLRVVRPDGSRARGWRCAARYALLFWGFLLLPRWIAVLAPQPVAISAGADEYAVATATLGVVTFLVQAFWLVTVLIRAVRSAFGRPFVMLNGVMTDTRVMAEAQVERLRSDANRPSIAEEEAALDDLGATMEDAFADRLGDQFDDPSDEK